MSPALLLTLAMAGSHDCCCPTYTSSYYAAPYSHGYSNGYATPYAYSNGYSNRGYANYAPTRSYGSYAPTRSYANSAPSQSYAGQSSHQQHSAGYAPRQSSQMPLVQMTDRGGFEPALIKVNVGDTLEWRNVSSKTHTVTANPELAKNPAHVILPEGAKPFNSGDVAPGERFSYKFTVPGTYYYVCLPHEDMGMVGVVVVKHPEGHQPAATTPVRQRGNQNGGAY